MVGGGDSIPGPTGYPIQLIGRGTPSQVEVGGGVPHPSGSRHGMDYPPLQDWVGDPPPHQETEQHGEPLLHGGRYASCVHAGGFSSYLLVPLAKWRGCGMWVWGGKRSPRLLRLRASPLLEERYILFTIFTFFTPDWVVMVLTNSRRKDFLRYNALLVLTLAFYWK